MAVCFVVFLGDMASGVVSPTFSLYAEQLGISLALLGVINTVSGLTSLTTSIPIGSFSDRVSRPRVIQTGMFMFAAGLLTLSMASEATLLIAGRVLLALGMVMVFRIAAAHLGDITAAGGRSLAFGAYATALGLGFTAGSFLGGQLGEAYGIGTTYAVSAGIALFGLLFALRFLHDRDVEDRENRRTRKLRAGLARVAHNRQLLIVSLGNMLTSVAFAGAITTFFPIYGKSLLITQAAIGTMFAVRGLVSTMGRVPNGIVARILGNRAVMLSALALEIFVMFGIWATESTLWLTIFLAVEGLAFGGYLVASQTFIADHIESDVRGAAIGLNATASAIGSTLAPVVLGVIASTWGVRTVFPVTGAVLIAGFTVILVSTLAEGRQVPTTVQAEG
jgi:predicted MFS family arabinose efflux permease